MHQIVPVVSSTGMDFSSKPLSTYNEGSGETCSQKIELCMAGKPFKLSKPLVISMSIFGLLFLRSDKRRVSIVTRVYSILVLLILLGLFLKLFYTYADDQFASRSLFKIVVHLWSLHCVLNTLVTLKACNSENRFAEFLLKWSSLLETNRENSSENQVHIVYERETKRKFGVVLALTWLAFLLNCFCLLYLLFQTNFLDFIIAPMSATHPFVILVKIAISIPQIYMSASWIFPGSLFIFMSGVIYKEFEIFNRDLQKAIAADENLPSVEYFRCRHQAICQLVETADDVLSGFNAAGIIFSTCEAMLTLYALVSDTEVRADPIVLASHCFWFSSGIFYLVVIAYGGGYLNHMAHVPLKSVHNVKVKDTTLDFSLQMNMFLGKLTGESIGLTALDMFVIDKPTILTIAGAFVTYFIVLIQFNQTTCTPRSSICNCTDFLVNSTLQCSANLI